GLDRARRHRRERDLGAGLALAIGVDDLAFEPQRTFGVEIERPLRRDAAWRGLLAVLLGGMRFEPWIFLWRLCNRRGDGSVVMMTKREEPHRRRNDRDPDERTQDLP